jgi:hypothetical protein
MKVLDFRDRFLLTLSVHAGLQNREMDWPAWDALRRALFELISEAGDEARCPHDPPLSAGCICVACGRRVNRENTLPTEAA